MKQLHVTSYIFLLMLVVSACSPQLTSNTSTKTSSTKDKINENTQHVEPYLDEKLAHYRPKFNDTEEIATTTKNHQKVNFDSRDIPLHINKKLDPILDTIAMRNRNIKFVNGFRIQIYVGNDRKAADDAKVYTYQSFPEIYPYLIYQQPMYKVKIGDFLNRMDAERYFTSIKDVYPAAMILPDKVEIKKGMLVK
ncbi:SPOR domain-containing protein [Flectobacillus major]|uniref:SPOR domain-containing protein n=1 Tax=Flectobacillus major TaxID=103 RepID=UPI0004173FBD|nr:SPOR domain-containing protein [Flectobacillus major]